MFIGKASIPAFDFAVGINPIARPSMPLVLSLQKSTSTIASNGASNNDGAIDETA
jgi:hypothetical protein